MDLAAYNTTRFQVSLDVSAWAGAYDLTTVSWRLQARADPSKVAIALDLSSANGGAQYAGGVVVFSAALAGVAGMLGAYTWDFGFSPPGADFVRCDGGTLTVAQGVTR